ncbi:MotA/TolQ/ExbB proton channel family protein [Selenomonas flueggei]|uniref:MotA/TolQ/ExbB proton channel family protein n=1 Tax=Selenomonas flueggei TaxID=135080 RepID=UPI002673ADBE|nr:MotA/TolQ/ExbB proton channel family protein [Selenomonas flueggei]
MLLSLITIAIAVERFYYYRINRKGSRVFFQGVYHAAMQKDWSTITKLVQEFPSAISRIIESGMENAGTEASMKGAFADRMSMEAINFRRYLDYLSAIVTIGPLLGLLGTVTGMIQTFSVLDAGGGAAAITGGVGEALVATATGLCVAIIAFCVYTYFSHQLDAIVTDTERLCTTIVTAKKESWAAQ